MGIATAVSGALGKMGQETVRAVMADAELELVGVSDIRGEGRTVEGLPVYKTLEEMISSCHPQVIVDFTAPDAVLENTLTAIQMRTPIVVGTTGLSTADLQHIKEEAGRAGVGVAIIPNFAIGAVLMMKVAAEIARYLPQVEIIEMHHDQKIDSPSGTAIKTAEIIREAATVSSEQVTRRSLEKYSGARGAAVDGIHIHSVRLPGLIAHQEVIFGGPGQVLTIRHDSLSRESFMPGVIMAVKYVAAHPEFVYGLENIL